MCTKVLQMLIYTVQQQTFTCRECSQISRDLHKFPAPKYHHDRVLKLSPQFYRMKIGQLQTKLWPFKVDLPSSPPRPSVHVYIDVAKIFLHLEQFILVEGRRVLPSECFHTFLTRQLQTIRHMKC